MLLRKLTGPIRTIPSEGQGNQKSSQQKKTKQQHITNHRFIRNIWNTIPLQENYVNEKKDQRRQNETRKIRAPKKETQNKLEKLTTDGGTTENQLYKNQTERNITILYSSHIDTHNTHDTQKGPWGSSQVGVMRTNGDEQGSPGPYGAPRGTKIHTD
jgi:hypothetical protein